MDDRPRPVWSLARIPVPYWADIATSEIEMTGTPPRALEDQRAEFARNRFLAMPIAGTIAWSVIGVLGAFLPVNLAAWALFIGTGSIFGLGLLVARLIGEDLLGKTRPKNQFDDLFLHTVMMAWLVFAIAIPFFRIEPTSLPLTVGILAGLMWVPFSWMIQHWVGLFHGITRTMLVLAAWYLFPAQRFVVIPAVIVVIYLMTIYLLVTRPRR
ncbi:MAG: hypothetical protein AB7N65_01205 [Vicinamibacterales bacterium]